MDESTPTCNKRFASLGIPQTEVARRDYRELWQGKKANVPAAQQALFHRAKYNRTARRARIQFRDRKDKTMKTSSTPLTKLVAWQALEAHYSKVRELHLRKLFADDPKSGEHMTAEAVGIYFDYA